MIATVDQRGSSRSVVGRRNVTTSRTRPSRRTSSAHCVTGSNTTMAYPRPWCRPVLVFGGAIYSTLELHFTELLCGNEPPSLDQLLDVFQEAWRGRANRL